MSFTLLVAGTIAMSGPTTVKFGLFGDEIAVSPANTFKTLQQGSSSVAATTIYTVTGPVTQTIVKTMAFANTAGTPSAVVIYANGTGAINQIFQGTIPAGGTLSYGPNGWQMTDGTGIPLVASTPLSATGDATGVQSGSTLPLVLTAFGPGAVGPIGSATQVAAVSTDAKGRVSALSAVAIQIAESQVTGLSGDLGARALNTIVIGTTAPLTGGGDLSANRTLAIAAATQIAAGSMSAIDKLKLDNLWIDVTANTIAIVSPANSAALNVTNMNLILTNAPNGSTIFFPAGLYQFNAAWTYPAGVAKMFVFKGVGSNKAGSPATAFTELRWTVNVGGDIITLPGSGNGWYTEFQNITFTSSATQSAGALINVNGNVGTNFRDCSFQSLATGNTFFDVLFGGGGATNSWNSAVIDNCSFQGFTNSAIRVNSSGSSLVVSNSVIQGQWGSAAQVAASCLSMGWVGAFQTIGCDILGAVNNILVNPVAASSEVCASLQCTNTYFDNSLGSCIKNTGTGAFVRGKFDTCTFTTAPGAGFAAVELGGSFVYPVGGQDIAFVNCNVYNTFGTTGASTGFLITNAADVSFTNCKVAGWNVGYSVTPMAGNKTNVQIIGGTVGPSGGFGLNTTGFLIAAGAYKGLQIRGCNALGNTANLNLGAVTVNAGEASLFAITDCAGINPKGAVTTPTFPTSTTVVTNTTGFRVYVGVKGGTSTAVAVNGVAAVLAATPCSVTLEPGGTIAITFSVAPTWVWVGQ